MLRGWAGERGSKVLEKKIAESCQVLFTIEVLEHVLASRAAKWAESGSGVLDQFDACHKVFQRARTIEEAVLAVEHKFRNARDCWCERGFTVSHGLHEDKRNALAATGEHDQVGTTVVGVEIWSGQVANQTHFISKIQILNQPFDGRTLQPLPCDDACEVNLSVL